MECPLKYGKQYINTQVPDEADIIEIKPSDYRRPSREMVTADLKRHLTAGAASAGIVVSDKTRHCEYDRYLPWLTDVLTESGLQKDKVRFYIAYGTHPRQSDNESIDTYGTVYNNYEFIHHDCDDTGSMISLGNTSRGTPVRIRRDVLNHDLLILFGSLSHHYFAGYGGGRKLIFPGLAERESIYANHRLFIDFDKMILNPGCRSGNLKDNPVAEDLREIDSLMPDRIIISGIPGSDGNINRLICGTGYDDFLAACSIYDDYFRKEGSRTYDNVIAGTGGYPKDINFIQSHKSLHNAASFVRDGGNLILLAECRDGIGNAQFTGIFKGNRKAMFGSLRKAYSGNGGTALSLLSKTERINVKMITNLDKATCNILNIKKITQASLQSEIDNLKGSIGIIKNASMIYC